MHNNFNYVISLASAFQRREHITKEFSSQNIPFNFFDAVNWREKPAHPNLSEQITSLLSNSNKLSDGEKGCFASHLALWQKCIELDLPYICIFEDDVVLSKQANQFLTDSNWLTERFDLNDSFILRFETFLFPVVVNNTNIANYTNYSFVKLKSNDYGTAGYLISQSAVKELLSCISNFSEDELQPIDELIFNYFINVGDKQKLFVYQLNPAICIQELQLNKEKSNLNSQLEEMRNSRRENEKSQRKEKLKRKTLTELLYHLFTKPQRMMKKRKLRIQEQRIREQKVIVPFE